MRDERAWNHRVFLSYLNRMLESIVQNHVGICVCILHSNRLWISIQLRYYHPTICSRWLFAQRVHFLCWRARELADVKNRYRDNYFNGDTCDPILSRDTLPCTSTYLQVVLQQINREITWRIGNAFHNFGYQENWRCYDCGLVIS